MDISGASLILPRSGAEPRSALANQSSYARLGIRSTLSMPLLQVDRASLDSNL